MNIEILGPRGVGKTTIAKELSTIRGIEYVSLGKLARREIRDRTALGVEMEGYINRREPYPKGFLVDLVSNELERTIRNGGFILDGYPRQATEARELVTILDGLHTSLDAVVEVNLDIKYVLSRITQRFVCDSCDFQIEEIEDLHHCPRCDGSLTKRTDDSEESLRHAYEMYHRESAAILEVLLGSKMMEVLRVDGSPSPSFIVAGIIHHINSLSE